MRSYTRGALLVACLVLAASSARQLRAAPAPQKDDVTRELKHRYELVEPNQYVVYWDYNNTDIIFEIHVKNAKWAAFGITPSGSMAGSDVIVTFNEMDAKSGKMRNYFTDRHIPKGKAPKIDTVQDWKQLNSAVKDGYLISRFTRKLALCGSDNDEDIDIVEGTPKVIFAWGDQLYNGDITYHNSNRGTRSLPLISMLQKKTEFKMSDDIETFDMIVNASIINGYHTEYYCEMFKIPTSWIKQKRHLLRYETIITPGNEDLVHHWVLQECNKDFENVYLKKNKNKLPSGGPCMSLHESQDEAAGEYDEILKYCPRTSLVWAVGSDNIQDFPDDMAYPMGGDDGDFTYMILQMHYDNAHLQDGLTDKSGIRLLTTTNYKPIELGTFTVGSTEEWDSITVPPRTDRFPVDFYCRSGCLDTFTDTEEGKEVTIIGALPHTHLKGKEVYTSIIRDGETAEYIVNNKNYDFNYQYMNFLSNPVKLRKGDQMKTTCVYGTPNEKDFVFGGLATLDEMCASFVWYYPKQKKFGGCLETFKKTDWVTFYDSLEKSGDVQLTADELDTGKFFPNVKYIGNRNLGKQYEEFMEKSKRIEVCFNKGNVTVTDNNDPIRVKPMKPKSCKKQ